MAGNLLTRDDTFFGVCEGLGEDLHISANLLRIAFAVGLLASVTLTIKIYLALGLVVLASRLLFPARVRRRTVRTPRTSAPAQQANDPLPDLAEAA